MIVQQSVRSSLNASDTRGRVIFNVVRSGSIGDVTVYWRLGLEAVDDFYPPLNGSVSFRDVINRCTSLYLL